MSVKNIAILFSGRGSNLKILLEKLHNKTFNNTTINVALVITNNKNAGGIKYAKAHGIEPVIIEHTQYRKREEFDAKLVQIIKQNQIDLTVLAGFMRILSPVFTSSVRAINLHPSLLPLFKGSNAIEESYKSDMLVGGVSVHFVSEELDAGELIAQEAFQKNDMTQNEFEEKIHQIEHILLPKSVIKILCN